MRELGKHLRSNVVAYVALFFSLGAGSAWAANELTRNSVESHHIVDREVMTPDLAPQSIHGGKVERHAIAGRHIRPGSVTQQKLADGIDADTVDGADASEFARRGSQDWQPLALKATGGDQCNWVNVGGEFADAAYMRDEFGFVHLHGRIKAVDGAVVSCDDFLEVHRMINSFTGGGLPAGYEPAKTETFPITANHKPGSVDVRPDGSIVKADAYPAMSDAEVWLSLDGISFRCGPSGSNGCP